MSSSSKVVGGSSSGAIGASGNGTTHPVRAKYVVEAKNKNVDIRNPPANVCIVINSIYYLKPFCATLIRAEPLENIGSDLDRAAFVALRTILTQLQSGRTDPINIYPFLDKFCLVITMNLSEIEGLDVSFIMDSVIKLITVVIPPLREVFLGRISSSLDIPGWMNLMSRCFHAQFVHPTQTLEDVMRSTLLSYDGDVYDDEDEDDGDEDDDDSERFGVPADRIRAFNAKIIYRAPEILVFAIESSHLPLSLRFTDMCSKTPLSVENKSKAPTAIRFPASFDVSVFLKEYLAPTPAGNEDTDDFLDDEAFAPKWYDLASVVTLEGSDFYNMDAFYRMHAEDSDPPSWYRGSCGANHEVISSDRAISRNYFEMSESRIVHPRLLIYTKRGITSVLQRLRDYVTKAGQMRSLGDATFESAETPEHYDEAKHYYEEAIIYDESLRSVLQERLQALEQIERNQRAHSYETQADISLGRRRFKEACDLYKNAMRSAVVNSTLYLRIREKEDYMMKIISLEIANHLTEKGLDCVKSASFAQAKEHFAQALKLNPNYVHLHSIIAGIEQAITEQASAQKVNEANQAMKVGKYKLANQLFLESIALIPSRKSTLQSVLDSLVDLMQGEEALIKQRAGLVALEDKKYMQAIDFITEAITLLPEDSKMEHGFFLCDRAQVYFEMKEYETAIRDCSDALKMKPDLAIAYLRLGASQFELGRYDDATYSYERAIRNDPSLGDQVKVKVRQVNTAKEVLQRKEREAERARIKEEEKQKLEERRAREESLKIARQQKVAQEQAEKAERMQFKDEEKRMRNLLQREAQIKKEQAKALEKERVKREKAARDAARAQERERLKAEKERERERIRQEKESKIKEEKEAKILEEQRRQDFAAEMEKAQARQKELEKEKEAEKEKARLEMERTIAEREKARQEKLAEGKKSKAHAGKEKYIRSDTQAGLHDRRFIPSANEAFPSLQSAAAAIQSFTNPASTPSSAETRVGSVTGSVHFNNEMGIASGTARPVTNAFTGAPGVVGIKHWNSVISSDTNSADMGKRTVSNANCSHNGTSNPTVYYPTSSGAKAYNIPGPSFNDAIINGTGYEFHAGGGSAWADHERAMLEATAARMSESSHTTQDNDFLARHAPSSSSASPLLLSSTGTDTSASLLKGENDQMSQMLSTLAIGSPGVLASLRSGSTTLDLPSDGNNSLYDGALGDLNNLNSMANHGQHITQSNRGGLSDRVTHDSAGLGFSQSLGLGMGMNQAEELSLNLDTFSSLLDGPQLQTRFSGTNYTNSSVGSGNNQGGGVGIGSDFSLERQLLSDDTLLNPIQDFRRNQSDSFIQQRGVASDIGAPPLLSRAVSDGNSLDCVGSGLPSLLDVGVMGNSLLGSNSLNIDSLHGTTAQMLDGLEATDTRQFGSLLGGSDQGPSLLSDQLPPLNSPPSFTQGTFDITLGAHLNDSKRNVDPIGDLNLGGQTSFISRMPFPPNVDDQSVIGQRCMNSTTPPLSSFLPETLSPASPLPDILQYSNTEPLGGVYSMQEMGLNNYADRNEQSFPR